jgi:bacteriorhodopsin
MIVTGLFSTLVPARSEHGERARWFFYAISCIGYLGIIFVMVTGGGKGVSSSPLLNNLLMACHSCLLEAE